MGRRRYFGDETKFLQREPKLKSELPKKEKREQPQIKTYQTEPFTDEEIMETERQKERFVHKPVSTEPLPEKTTEPAEESLPRRTQRDEMKPAIPSKLRIRKSKGRR